jgi:hypothetical protein
MIVRPGNGVLLHLVTQPDHAALARRIMEHCEPLARAPRRESILLAIGEHDNGWRELDEQPAIDANGRVVDFMTASTEAKQAVWPRGVARLAAADPLAAALVAHHAVTIYDRFRGDPEWSAFFPEMQTMRDRLLASAGLAVDALLHDYAFVRVGDLISLTFCTKWQDKPSYDRWKVSGEDDRVVVTPDPFDASEIAIEVSAWELPDRSFESDSAFRESLANARRVTLKGVVESRR